MSEVEIDWQTAVVENSVLRVKFAARADDLLYPGAQQTIKAWEGETRGQTWKDMDVSESGITVRLQPDTDEHHLQTYLAELIDAAARAGAREREASDAARRKAADDALEAAARDDERTKRFRSPPA